MTSLKAPRPDGPAMTETRTASHRSGGAPRSATTTSRFGGGGGQPAVADPRPDSKRERARLLSLALIELIKKRVTELSGFLLVLTGGLLGAMLASYSPNDSSWNTVKGVGMGGPIHNLIGLPGAYISDLIAQTVGFGGFLLVAALTVWGIRLALLAGVSRPVWRGVMLVLAVVFASVVLAALPPFQGTGLFRAHAGGSVGLVILERLGTSAWKSPVLVLSGLVATLLFLGALGAPVLAILRVGPGIKRTGGWLAALPATIRQHLATSDRATSDRASSGGPSSGGFMPSLAGKPVVGGRTEPSFGPQFGGSESGSVKTGPACAEDAGDDAASVPEDDADLDADSDINADEGEGDGGGGEMVAAPLPQLRRLEPVAPAAIRKPLPPLPRADEDATYQLPGLELLRPAPQGLRNAQLSEDEMRRHAGGLTSVLGDFGVRGEIKSYRPGPVVTLYELEPAPGTKSSRVIGLADDLARSMCAISVRVAVVPGRNVIGIELPNPKRETVWLRELLEHDAYARTPARLALVLGKDIGGAPVIADLARMPHLLIAGTTGSGKSVGINTMILSLLYRMTPDQCKFIMVDPKMLELSVYDGIPHLLAPVVTDPKRAVVALKWTVREMEDRYRNMSKLGVRNIEGYNARLREARAAGTPLSRRVQTGFDPDTGKPIFEEQPLDLNDLPYIVVVVDEMADLMLVAGKDIEATIQRLAQMARAAGIHIIMATQRPSVDVITGTIKANFPTRISFQVTSKIDSRTILGEQGAEQLRGQGDMLYMAGGGRVTRVHGPFVSDGEVEEVVRVLKAQGEPCYIDAVTEDIEEEEGDAKASSSAGGGGGGSGAGGSAGSDDELYDKAVAMVARERKASTSYVQRFLRIGYNSAARLIERMEKEGVISKPNVSGKREVLARKPDDPR